MSIKIIKENTNGNKINKKSEPEGNIIFIEIIIIQIMKI